MGIFSKNGVCRKDKTLVRIVFLSERLYVNKVIPESLQGPSPVCRALCDMQLANPEAFLKDCRIISGRLELPGRLELLARHPCTGSRFLSFHMLLALKWKKKQSFSIAFAVLIKSCYPHAQLASKATYWSLLVLFISIATVVTTENHFPLACVYA